MRSRRWSMLCLGAALAWLLVRLPFLVQHGAEMLLGTGRQSAAWTQAGAALQQPAAKLIQDAVGITPEMVTFLRSLPRDTPVVLFSPYDTAEARFLLRLMFERVRNLVYPSPREVSFADGTAALQPLLVAKNQGRLVVMDYTQGEQPLPVAAEFELAARGLFVRFWRLVKVQR